MTTNTIRALPELAALEDSRNLIRISPDQNIPLTDRVRRIIDTPVFRRLARIGQLGLVSLVYPSATHSRFEHSLGVYRNALLFLRHLSSDERFERRVSTEGAELLVVSSLLHDLGHWPFCHPIEDLYLPDVPRHEEFIGAYLSDEELGRLLRDDWSIDPAQVQAFLEGRLEDDESKLLASVLSGPIDIDKVDYLNRDSVHAGVPYGNNFDQHRLISSLCLNERGDGLAITDKGKTAAELLLFARYVMFSEVYWHHGVRAATAMLQRSFFLLRDKLDLETLFLMDDRQFIAELERVAIDGPAEELLSGLFGERRSLYKRAAQYSHFENENLYERLAYRPYAVLTRFSSELANQLSARLGRTIRQEDILVDAPPVKKEVEFRLDVLVRQSGVEQASKYRSLEEVSPVVRALAREQFDDYVKRVRIFVQPQIAPELSKLEGFAKIVECAAETLPPISPA